MANSVFGSGSYLGTKWKMLADRIDGMSLRERALIFIMVAVIVLTFMNTVFLDPLFAKQREKSQLLTQQQSQMKAAQTAIQELLKANDPDKLNRVRLAQLEVEIKHVDLALADLQKSLVPPQKMGALLEDILRQNGQLRLVSLKTLPASSIADASKPGAGNHDSEAKTNATPGALIYRHGVEITLEGSYPELLRYVSALERLPWRMFWGRVSMTTETYPKTTLVLTLYTLSLEETWLSV
jgi:MSHA biogenesis protein MshJ